MFTKRNQLICNPLSLMGHVNLFVRRLKAEKNTVLTSLSRAALMVMMVVVILMMLMVMRSSVIVGGLLSPGGVGTFTFTVRCVHLLARFMPAMPRGWPICAFIGEIRIWRCTTKVAGAKNFKEDNRAGQNTEPPQRVEAALNIIYDVIARRHICM